MTKRTKPTRRTRGGDRPPAEPRPAYIALPTTRLCVVDPAHHPFDSDGVPIPVAAAPDSQLCAGHRYDLDAYAEQVKALFIDLALLVGAGSGSPRTGARSKSAEPPAPIDLVAAALRDHRNPTASDAAASRDIPSVPGVVASWLIVVANEKPLWTHVRPVIGWRIHPDGSSEEIRGGRARGVLPSSVIGQLDLLARNHGWMCQQWWAGRYWAQLKQARDALWDKVGDLPDRSTNAIALEIAEAAAAR